MRGKGKGRGAWPSPLPQAVIVALLCNQKSVAKGGLFKTFFNAHRAAPCLCRNSRMLIVVFFLLLDVSTSQPV